MCLLLYMLEFVRIIVLFFIWLIVIDLVVLWVKCRFGMVNGLLCCSFWWKLLLKYFGWWWKILVVEIVIGELRNIEVCVGMWLLWMLWCR